MMFLEDTILNLYSMEKKGLQHDLLRDLVLLTRNKTKETYEEYINRLSLSPRAVRVKIADLKDNLRGDPSYYPDLKERYRKALEKLEKLSGVTK
jgi:hypothetical protein